MSKFKITKQQFVKHLFKTLIIIFGNILLAFGTATFLTNLNIVAGGLSGIGIIIQYFFGASAYGGQIIDIVVFIFTWLLWIIGLIFLGKEFAIKTLIAAIVYPLALSFFLRIDVFQKFADMISYWGMSYEGDTPALTDVPVGNILICGLFGGVFVGGGVALSFMGGGSSGGIDVIIAILEKYTPLKASVISFILDASIIVVGMFVIPNNIIPGLVGIISAFVTAMMIEFVYVGSQTAYQVDIISEHWKEIDSYAQDVLLRGTTIIHAEGGYKGEERIILRVVFDKAQYLKIKDYIAKVDPKAFVTFTQTNAVYGEGFKSNKVVVSKPKKKEK